MNKLINFSTIFIKQFIGTMPMHIEGYKFIKKHRPWTGMDKYGWAAKLLLFAAILLGIFLFWDVFLLAKDAVIHPDVSGASISSFFTDFSFDKFDWILGGSKKYLVLIVLEIFTFHFIQRTLEIQMGREPENTFKIFIAAEKRMIKVSIIAYIMEIITITIVSTLLGLIGLKSTLGQPSEYLIQFYFLGFIIIDNYHECFRLSIKESRKKAKEVMGIAVAIGGVAYFLMYIPIIGVVAATMIGAVTATLAMQRFSPLEVAEEEELV